ncbi:MAG: hypothetical protein ACJAVI_000837 [Candidatus Azotimanducaceae bacterium]|jgi:hypothetical protein
MVRDKSNASTPRPAMQVALRIIMLIGRYIITLDAAGEKLSRPINLVKGISGL